MIFNKFSISRSGGGWSDKPHPNSQGNEGRGGRGVEKAKNTSHDFWTPLYMCINMHHLLSFSKSCADTLYAWSKSYYSVTSVKTESFWTLRDNKIWSDSLFQNKKLLFSQYSLESVTIATTSVSNTVVCVCGKQNHKLSSSWLNFTW